MSRWNNQTQICSSAVRYITI